MAGLEKTPSPLGWALGITACKNTVLPLLIMLFLITGNSAESAGVPLLLAAAESKQKIRSLNIPKLKEPLRISRYQCEPDLTWAPVMIDSAYLQSKLGDSRIEAVPSILKYRLRLVNSEINSDNKDIVVCRYGVSHGKIDDFRYQRLCRDARKDPVSGEHAYKCAE